jgi:hypothetical protein
MKTSFLAKIKAASEANASKPKKPASPAKTTSSYVPPKCPPTREPARSWAAVPPSQLAREHFRVQVLETATYRPEHYLGISPLVIGN